MVTYILPLLSLCFICFVSKFMLPVGDEADEDIDDEYKTPDDHILFVIDARPEMFELNSKGESHIINSLKVALSVMKSKIIMSERSCVGITLFGSDVKNRTSDAKHPQICTLLSLEVS